MNVIQFLLQDGAIVTDFQGRIEFHIISVDFTGTTIMAKQVAYIVYIQNKQQWTENAALDNATGQIGYS
jgi:hypothetical protein